MKITITKMELINSFEPALKELATFRTPSRAAYNVAKTLRSIKNTVDIYNSTYTNIVETRCEKVNGKPKSEGGVYSFPSKEIETEAFQLLSEIHKEEEEIEIFPIKLNDLDEMLAPQTVYDKESRKPLGVEYIKAAVSGKLLTALREFIEEN